MLKKPSLREVLTQAAEPTEWVGGQAIEDRLFNDNLTDPDLIARQIVKKTLTLIDASRHGLQVRTRV